jgi:hypothetical protein
MIAEDDRRFVAECLDAHFASFAMMLPARRSPGEVDGVPPDMVAGPADAEGWVPWKMLPSTVAEADVERLEEILPAPFPPLFRAYLTTRFTLGMDWFDLPNLPSDRPLAELEAAMNRWQSLWDVGYVCFADNAEGDTGPMCFDLFHRLPDGDCPVVLFDQEQLRVLGDGCRDRAQVEPLVEPRQTSFREMLRNVLLQRPPEAEPERDETPEEELLQEED